MLYINYFSVFKMSDAALASTRFDILDVSYNAITSVGLLHAHGHGIQICY